MPIIIFNAVVNKYFAFEAKHCLRYIQDRIRLRLEAGPAAVIKMPLWQRHTFANYLKVLYWVAFRVFLKRTTYNDSMNNKQYTNRIRYVVKSITHSAPDTAGHCFVTVVTVRAHVLQTLSQAQEHTLVFLFLVCQKMLLLCPISFSKHLKPTLNHCTYLSLHYENKFKFTC